MLYCVYVLPTLNKAYLIWFGAQCEWVIIVQRKISTFSFISAREQATFINELMMMSAVY
jgi:hypothetical protein